MAMEQIGLNPPDYPKLFINEALIANRHISNLSEIYYRNWLDGFYIYLVTKHYLRPPL